MVDWNYVLSYNTVKIVLIRDWRLGALHYIFMFCIVAYIGVFTIGIEQRYLIQEAPVGSVRLSLEQGLNPPPPEDLAYCYVYPNQTAINDYENYPCIYFDQQFVVYPTTEQSAMFITTRVRIEEQSVNCSLLSNLCSYDITNQTTYYTADIEDFTIMIDHSVYAPGIGIQYNGKTLPGELLDNNNEKFVLTGGDVVGEIGQSDVLRLGTLLKAAGIDSLDGMSQVNASSSMRYDGIVIIVFIEYSNTYSYNLDHTKYTYRAHVVTNTKFKAEEPVFTKNIASRVLYVRHGVRMIFIQEGSLGKFDFQVMLLTFVSGVGLLTAATVIVDIIAVYFIPEKSLYKGHKYEVTANYERPINDTTPLIRTRE